MKEKPVIQKVIALVMLLVFTFSMTPRNYWDKCFADHDNYSVAADGKTTITKTGADCNCDELVVSTPFTETAYGFQLHFTPEYGAFHATPYHFFSSTTYSAKDSRGPPAVA